MLCCLEEARRYKKCGHMMVNHDSNCERIYVLYMTTNKNRKVNFLRKNVQPRQVSPLNYHKTLNAPLFVHPTKISEKISPH